MRRKIRKFKGGGADMGAPERAQERADRGYGSTSPVDRTAVGTGSKSDLLFLLQKHNQYH